MSDPVWIALLSGPLLLGLREGIAWLRNRHKEDAETGLTIDQRWEKYADAQDERIGRLEKRVTSLEDELSNERERSKGLAAEVDRYKQIGRSLLRYVLRLRDGLITTGAEVPPMPADIEDAMTYFNLP